MKTIYYNGPISELFGYGILGKNLAKEMSKICDFKYIQEGFNNRIVHSETQDLIEHKYLSYDNGEVNSPVIFIGGPDFKRQYKGINGSFNVGHFYFETDKIKDEYIKNIYDEYDWVVTGSKWNEEILREHGIKNVSTIVQGVDRNIFNSKNPKKDKDKFYLFSGGKFEQRKGQDLVLKAFDILADKYKDMYLITSWYNVFVSPEDNEKNFRQIKDRVIYLPVLDQYKLSDFMRMSDIGIFPNRIEGGTNLVLMEYLACGHPTIATYSTGQKDVLDKSYSFLLYPGEDNKTVDMIVEYVKYAYENREQIKAMGGWADMAMNDFSWEKNANEFYKVCYEKVPCY